MSSHSRKLAETLRMIDNLKAALKSTALDNEYSRGMYNGVEMMRSLLNGTKAEIIDKLFNQKEGG